VKLVLALPWSLYRNCTANRLREAGRYSRGLGSHFETIISLFGAGESHGFPPLSRMLFSPEYLLERHMSPQGKEFTQTYTHRNFKSLMNMSS
jgi:hypothetical protein